MLADDCVFCRILKGEIPCTKVYEDEKVLAFLDIAPFNLGHTVIVPKHHEVSSTQLDAEYLSAMMTIAPRIGAALIRAGLGEGFNLVLNNGRVAGQMVPHVHLHVVPRRADDQVVFTAPGTKYDSPSAMEEVASQLRDSLKGGEATTPPQE